MRHAGASRPKSLRSLCVPQLPLRVALVALTSFTHRLPARQPGASIGAVDLPAVAARADMDVLAATRAEKEASCIVHRRSQSADEPSTSEPGACYTSARTCACHGGGTASGWNCKFSDPVPCLVLSGVTRLANSGLDTAFPQGGLALFTGRIAEQYAPCNQSQRTRR